MSTFLETLEDAWQKGRLKDLEADLERFIRKHAEEIRASVRTRDQTVIRVAGHMHDQGRITDREMIDLSVRAILRRCGTVNPKRDIIEQYKEISNEIWYEGERICGPVPLQRQEEIARTWAHMHAAKWREWRLREILFTWEKKIADFMKLLMDGGTTARRGNSTRHRKSDE